MSIFKRFFSKKNNIKESDQQNKKDELAMFKEKETAKEKKINLLRQKNDGIMDVVRCNSPYGSIKIQYAKKSVIVDEETYKKIVETKNNYGIDLIPYAQGNQKEISDVLKLKLTAVMMVEKKIQKMDNTCSIKNERNYSIFYEKAQPYMLLNEDEKQKVKKLIEVLSSDMVPPLEKDITKNILEKLSNSKILEKRENMANFSLEKFLSIIKSVRVVENESHGVINIINSEKDGKKLNFLLIENVPLEAIDKKSSLFMECDENTAVKISYNGGYAWIVLYRD
ncbi:MAG: hypothetical protein QW153_02130 [Candidatus Bilamarchaeaceae archaeon]